MDGVKYLTTEQAMMAYKAQVFGDEDKRAAIMAAKEPKMQKKLGRQVANFDAKTWDKVAFDLVTKANLHKFQQNPDLKESLLDTGDRTIVEASARDRKWGIGLAVTDPRAQDPTKWRGENLLGKALMKVREQLHAEAAENKKQVKCTCNPRTIAGGLGHAFWCAKVMDGFAQDHKRRRVRFQCLFTPSSEILCCRKQTAQVASYRQALPLRAKRRTTCAMIARRDGRVSHASTATSSSLSETGTVGVSSVLRSGRISVFYLNSLFVPAWDRQKMQWMREL